MKGKGPLWLAGLMFIGGLALLIGFHWYIKPQMFSKEVVRVTTALARNGTVSAADVSLTRVDSQAVPDHAITDVRQVIGKQTNVELSVGTIVTRELVDVEGLQPDASEGYFPIPKSAIYAVGGSLRARDEVDIYLIQVSSSASGGKVSELADEPTGNPLLKRIQVIAVRSDAGNMIMDTDRGNTNGRITSTERISNLEVKISDEQGDALKRWIEAGYLLWIVRVT